jgi:arginyl-tRNA synthetase
MYSVSNYLKNYLQNNVTKTFSNNNKGSGLPPPHFTNFKVEVSTKGADYQTSLPLAISKSLKQSPKEITDKIIQNLSEEPALRKAYFTEPGFLNIELDNQWIANYIQSNVLQRDQNKIHWKPETDRKRVLVDYASPNMCKELHVGHLRSVVLGESLSRILEYVGHHVQRISHVGDFGTPIGLVLAQAIESNAPFVQSLMNSSSGSVPQPQELSSMYVAAKQRSKSDPQFAHRAQDLVVQLQRKLASDPNDSLVAIYRSVCAASRSSFEDIFRRLSVSPKLKEQGESFYVNLLPGVVDELKQKGIAVEDQGATCVFVDGFKAPFIIQKSDGAYLYSTTDLAALQYRLKQGLEWMVYVTDESQKPHFQQLFKVSE